MNANDSAQRLQTNSGSKAGVSSFAQEANACAAEAQKGVQSARAIDADFEKLHHSLVSCINSPTEPGDVQGAQLKARAQAINQKVLDSKPSLVGAANGSQYLQQKCSGDVADSASTMNALSTVDKNAKSVKGEGMNPWVAGGIGAIAGAGLLAGGLAIGGVFDKDKGGGGGGGSSRTTPVTTPPTIPTPPPALTGPGETPEGSQNLTANNGANPGTPQNLTPATPGTEENQGALGRSGSALSSGAGSSGAGSGAGSGGGASSAGAQGRMANARSASTGGGGSGFSPSSFGGGGGGGDGKELKDGAAVGYAAALKGCQPKVAKQMRDSRTKKMLTVMIDNPNYKQCKPLEAKSKVRTPASSKRAAKIKTDALLN
jgi:hypothetical protein